MKNEKKNVLIIFGGASPEYEVSCSSAAGVSEAIDTERYEVTKVGITKGGEWFYTEASADEMRDSVTWLKNTNNRKAVLSTDRADHGIIIFDEDGSCTKKYIDVIFPIVHGENGEDGTLQGLFEIAGIPYIGSGVCSSACSMDKAVTRIFAEDSGMLQPRCYFVDRKVLAEKKEAITEDIEKYLNTGYPMIVKPSMTGSSVGVSKADSKEELYEAILLAAGHKGKIMIEEYISGKELKVAVFNNNGKLEVGKICEIIMQEGCFNDYELKYKGKGTHKKIPAELEPETERRVKEDAVKIFEELNCKDYARVDFFLTMDQKIYFNEINTIPGISAKSIFSLMVETKDMDYRKMVNTLVSENI